DGSQAATATPAQIQTAVADARAILAAANIELTFDPDSDVTSISSTLLNHDCLPPAPGTNLMTDKDHPPPEDCSGSDNERDRIAQLYPGKLVVYFSTGDRLYWNGTQWAYGPRGFSWSNHISHFVAMTSGAPWGELLAHEMGDYLHLTHTMFPMPETVADAQRIVREYVEGYNLPRANGLNVFDNDGIDTPPDPGQQLFTAAGLDPCNPAQGVLLLPVTWTDGTSTTYYIAPDRENIMSYWNKTCRGLPPHVSPGQIARVRDAIENGNRQHLMAPKVLHS